MAEALAGHDALARAAVTDNRGIIVKTTGDGLYAAFEDSLDALNATVVLQAVVGRPGGDQRHSAARALRIALGPGRAPRQRLLRQPGQSDGARDERRPRRPDPAVASGGRRHRQPAAARGDAPRSRQRPAQGPVAARARLPGAAPVAAPGFSGAALARGDAQQSAAAADVVHRPRARGRRGQGTAEEHARSSRCSAWVASARRACRCRSPPI